MIELIHISKSFGQHQVLHELTFTFEDGKVYGIVGENGAGKQPYFVVLQVWKQLQGRSMRT